MNVPHWTGQMWPQRHRQPLHLQRPSSSLCSEARGRCPGPTCWDPPWVATPGDPVSLHTHPSPSALGHPHPLQAPCPPARSLLFHFHWSLAETGHCKAAPSEEKRVTGRASTAAVEGRGLDDWRRAPHLHAELWVPPPPGRASEPSKVSRAPRATPGDLGQTASGREGGRPGLRASIPRVQEDLPILNMELSSS